MAGRSYSHKRKPGGFDSYLLTNVLYHHAEKIERERKGSSPPVDGSETFKQITMPATGIFSWECAWRQVEQRDGRLAVLVDEEAFARVRSLLARRRRNGRRRGFILRLSQIGAHLC